jgi:hypothetical protein
LVSVGAASFDLSAQSHYWQDIRIAIWIVQILLIAATACFWRFEKPRKVKIEGLPKPAVLYGS